MAAREAELADLVAARRDDIVTYQNRLAAQAKESEEAEAKILSQTAQFEAAGETVAALVHERGARLAAVSEQESQTRALRDSLNDLRDLRGKEEVRQTQLQLRIENLAEHVMRRYQVDLRAFTTDTFAFQKTLSVVTKRRAVGSSAEPVLSRAEGPLDDSNGGETATVSASPAERPIHPDDEANLEQIITDLTRQLDNMGPVNLDAVHEYDELEERYRFLETQNSDLIGARREVLDVITRINSTTQKLFAETFAQVRINFREMFGELFDGGRADLSLVDENDPLNCGIDITAKPPGKQLQSISLLSGGERTMTAVALLFAIYMVRPSPFCILDEMDAPLDESNINRFIRVLDRFVTQSQFIIITHNKRTIAKADILYGVTMEERGVSKLVGMKLTEGRGSDGELKKQASNGNGTTAREQKPRQAQFAMTGESDEQRHEVAARR
jgi:chromosome segregation protein